MGNNPSSLNDHDAGKSSNDAPLVRVRTRSQSHDRGGRSSAVAPLRTSSTTQQRDATTTSSRSQKDVAALNHHHHHHHNHQASYNQPEISSRPSYSRQSSIQQRDGLTLNSIAASVAQPHETLESAEALHNSQSRTSATDVLRGQSQSSSHNSYYGYDTQQLSRRPSSRPSSRHTSFSSGSIMGQNESKIKSHAKGGAAAATPSTPSVRPLDTSTTTHKKKLDPLPQQLEDESSYMLPLPNFGRPPRLPLPIKGSVHAPGSPILSPADLQDPIEFIGDLPRRSSLLSSTTLDDSGSDHGDDLNTVRGGVLPPVPTTVEWREEAPGNKVYVTGTFADWDNKYKLIRRDDGIFALTLNLQPGTYHLRFIVNGEMVLSSNLPTAVDFTNCLVNYLEVIQEIPTSISGKEPYLPPHLQQGVTQPIPVKRPHTSHGPSDTQVQQVPPTPELAPVAVSSSVPPESSAPVTANLPLRLVPEREYTDEAPRFFQDVEADADTSEDVAAPEDFWRSNELTQALPTPPTLPGFLTKSIHNMHTPIKDDASVLANPNHTVLNHLTTSSIKGGVIATSMTTRYGRKFLTTILYKPTQPND